MRGEICNEKGLDRALKMAISGRANHELAFCYNF